MYQHRAIKQQTKFSTASYLRHEYHNKIVELTEKKCDTLRDTHDPYLMTTILNPPDFPYCDTLHFSQHCFRHHNGVYLHLCSTLVANYTRPSKRHLLPISFDFLDNDVSKTKMVQSLALVPHIHSIVLVRKEQAVVMDKLMRDKFQLFTSKQDLRYIQSVHAEPITHDLNYTIRYASKLMTNPIASSEVDLYTINPNDAAFRDQSRERLG